MFEFFLGLVLLGILAGLLSGFFGIGSGVILVPAYVFLFNLLDLPPDIIPILATGTSMTTMALTIPMAAYIHFKNNNVELEIVKKMFWMAFAMTLFGRYLALFIESSTLQIIIAVSLILAAVQIAFDFSPKSINIRKSSLELIFVAGLLGLVTSFVGIGGGIYLVPLIIIFGLGSEKEAAAAGATFICMNSLVGFAARFKAGAFDSNFILPLIGSVAIGGFLGSYYGSKKYDKNTIQKVMGGIIIVAIILLIRKIL